jgi:hypothetical protein
MKNLPQGYDVWQHDWTALVLHHGRSECVISG